MRRILFVVNPIAGGTDKSELLRQVEDERLQGHWQPEFLNTTGEGDARAIGEYLDQFAPDVVVAVGGDGTLNLVAHVLIQRGQAAGSAPQPLLALVPAGSANGLATELGIPADFADALAVIHHGAAAALDAIEVASDRNRSPCYCLHIGDVGLNARIVEGFERTEGRGMWHYARQFFRELRRSRPAKVDLTMDGRHWRQRAHMVAFANASRYGTGAVVNPEGCLDDGRFELCVFKPYPAWALLGIAWRFFLGNVNRSPYVQIVSGRQARLRLKRPTNLQVDGESLGEVREVRLHILPAALRLLVPADSHARLFRQSQAAAA